MQIVMDGIQSFQTFRRQPTTNSYRAIIYLFEHGGKDIDLLLASFQYILNNSSDWYFIAEDDTIATKKLEAYVNSLNQKRLPEVNLFVWQTMHRRS